MNRILIKIILVTSFVIYLQANVLFAEEKLTGVFGFKFGEYFNPNRAMKVIHTDDGYPLYVVKPPKSSDLFERYYVAITPKTRFIYTISAVAKIGDKSKCFKESDYIEELLKTKYLKLGEKTPARPVVNGYHLIQGTKEALVKCSFEGSITLHLIYRDKKLLSQSIKEEKELEAESRGDSGP